MIKFTVMGKPYGQKRPRAFRRGKFIGIYSPKENVEYTEKVFNAYLKVSPIIITKKELNQYVFPEGTPVSVKITAYYALPKVSKKELARNPKKYAMPLRKPDIDNCVKAILDSLTDTKACWVDDAQVVELIANKAYDNNERVEVELWEKKV